MGEQGLLSGYVAPAVFDYGRLVDMTAAVHPLMGAQVSDLSFSSPLSPGGIAEGGSDPTGTAGTVASNGGNPSGGGTSGGGTSGGGGSHGGGHLPFTGLAAGAVAGIGSALAAAGGALRRATRRRP
jgi:hypothetical protein